jgi:DNA uptake protein ComE-like DNA-binding protein
MKPSLFSSYFQFSKSQRNGIFVFLSCVVVFQFLYFWVDFSPISKVKTLDKKNWVNLKVQKDSSNEYFKNSKRSIHPFNPNFITDFKGYQLGMSIEEIDRLLAFRKTNRFVNSSREFQEVTKISDSLLQKIEPFFKFPDWVIKRNLNQPKIPLFQKKESSVVLDINQATAEDLKKIYGIGDGLSERILKEKEKLGGFVSMEQMKDIWGLSPEVIQSLQKEFTIQELPTIKKINVNTSSIKELMQLPYFKYPLAKAIVTFRSMNGKIKNVDELINISGFPVDKIKIIALYLEF